MEEKGRDLMATERPKTPSLESAVEKGGLKNLVRAMGEDSPEILTAVLGEVTKEMYGPMAGVAASFVIKLLHGALKGQGWSQIAVALKKLKDAGKIKEDFEDSDLGKACLAELLEAIDKNSDPRRIQALKNTFLRIAIEPGTVSDAIYKQQLLRIVGTLTSGEIVLLGTMYRVADSKEKSSSAERWLSEMAQESGFFDAGLVEVIELPLIERHLVTSRQLTDKSGVEWGVRNRLTSLGKLVCDFMLEPVD